MHRVRQQRVQGNCGWLQVLLLLWGGGASQKPPLPGQSHQTLGSCCHQLDVLLEAATAAPRPAGHSRNHVWLLQQLDLGAPGAAEGDLAHHNVSHSKGGDDGG